ncbi:hypothetical protein QE250_00360 [Chromatiaceae bacterium AAb-1]|nr:hypothetical protein [Chromatiaceae bacterium AAb-1]
MLTKNLALSSIFCFTLAALTACGGGSDDSTPTTPDTGTTPPPPTVPTPITGFASGLYIAETRGLTEIVVLDNTLYVAAADEENKQVWGRFDSIKEAITESKITTAEGISVLGTVVAAAELNANLSASNGNVTSLRSVAFGGESFSGSFAYSEIKLVTDLSARNPDWKEPDFSQFAIDSSLQLTAKDKNDCDISGTLTLDSGSQVFAVTLDYTNCDQAGQYEGALWAYTYDSVTYLSWVAFDSDNNVVSGKLDTYISQYDQLALTGEFNSQLFVNDETLSDDKVIVKGNQLWYLQGSKGVKAGDFVFDLSPVSNLNNVQAEGMGYTRSKDAVSADMDIAAPKRKYSSFRGEIFPFSASSRIFSVTPVKQALTDIKGNWRDITISAGGNITGKITLNNEECIVSGTASNFENSTANVEITFSSCAAAKTYDGAIAGYKNGTRDMLVLELFKLDTVAGTLGYVSATFSRL